MLGRSSVAPGVFDLLLYCIVFHFILFYRLLCFFLLFYFFSFFLFFVRSPSLSFPFHFTLGHSHILLVAITVLVWGV